MKAVVVGGGVIGLWCARDLLAAGIEVTVLDNGPQQPAVSTPASAGWVVPVMSSPLSSPGIVARSLRGLAARQPAAFSVRPAPSPELARWLWSFVRSGSAPRFREGLRAALDLAGTCTGDYVALRDAAPGLELSQDGLLMVARTAGGEHEARGLAEAAAAAGYDGKYDVLHRDELLHLEPALAPDVRGGLHARDELHVQPDRLLAVLRQDVVARGGVLRTEAGVRDCLPATGGRWSVVTADRTIITDGVVVAAGYWSKALLARMGVRIPLQPAAGVSITATGHRPPSMPLKLVEANVAVTPFAGGVRLAGRFALGATPVRVSPQQVERVVRAAVPYLHSWKPTVVSAHHVGLRPVTPDSLPLVGDVPGRQGVYAATGHGMLGLTLAPGTAREITHQVTTGSPTDRGRAFALTRPGLG